MKNRSQTLPFHYMLVALLLVLFTPSMLYAQNQFNLNALSPGQLVLNLSATEQVNVEQDTLNISLQYSAQGRNSTALQNEVNEAMRSARDILDNTDNIDWSIQGYHVYTVQADRPSRNAVDNPVWRAQQSVRMTSLNSGALLVVTAQLQDAGLTVSNMHYSLSSEKYEEVSDSLMNAALLKLQARADEAATTLNKSRADLVEVNINGNQGFFGGARMAMTESFDRAATMAVPVAEPGESQVSMAVNARALLSP